MEEGKREERGDARTVEKWGGVRGEQRREEKDSRSEV